MLHTKVCPVMSGTYGIEKDGMSYGRWKHVPCVGSRCAFWVRTKPGIGRCGASGLGSAFEDPALPREDA